MNIITDAFNDFKRRGLPQKEGLAGQSDLRNLAALQVGFGERSMRTDQDGMWFGGKTMADAPFSVDYYGNVTANAIQLASLVAINSGNGLGQLFTAPTHADISGSSFSLTFDFTTIVFMVVTASGYIERNAAGDFIGTGHVSLIIDGTERCNGLMTGGEIGTESVGASVLSPTATTYITSLAAGTHTFKLTGSCELTTNFPRFHLYSYQFALTTLGEIF